MSQESRLLKLLSDGAWHDTPGILEEVYGSKHLGICRIGARIFGLKKQGHLIESRKKEKTVWEYRLVRRNMMAESYSAVNAKKTSSVVSDRRPAELFPNFGSDGMMR